MKAHVYTRTILHEIKTLSGLHNRPNSDRRNEVNTHTCTNLYIKKKSTYSMTSLWEPQLCAPAPSRLSTGFTPL